MGRLLVRARFFNGGSQLGFIGNVEESLLESAAWSGRGWSYRGPEVGHFYALFYFATSANIFWVVSQREWMAVAVDLGQVVLRAFQTSCWWSPKGGPSEGAPPLSSLRLCFLFLLFFSPLFQHTKNSLAPFFQLGIYSCVRHFLPSNLLHI